MFFKVSNLILFIYFGSSFSVLFAEIEKCHDFDLPCDDGECIRRSEWCDGWEDCDDDSDEKYCSTANYINIECDENLHFRCYDGTCIPKVGYCNNYENCNDGSDEISCSSKECEEDEFRCEDNGCILKSKRCDEKQDCADGSDEKLCPETENVLIDIYPEKKIEESVNEALKWLLSQQQHDYSWGGDAPRALIALALTGNSLTNETWRQFAIQQLSSEIAVNLSRNKGEVSLYRLARYVKALIATCQNPFNFYGFDLVNLLRTRTNRVLEKKFVGPSIFLALCLANETRPKDFHIVHKLSWSIMNHHNAHLNRKLFDLEAYSAIASACMLKTDAQNNVNVFTDLLNRTFSTYFYEYKDVDEYTVALLLQGLNAWSSISPPLTYRRTQLISSLLQKQKEDGSFGDLLVTYFALPALQGKSLRDLQDIDCWMSSRPSSSYEYSFHNKDFFKVEISLWITSSFDTRINCMKFSVPPGLTLFNAMRFIGIKNPHYRFNYEVGTTGKMVYSISDIPNDGEKKMYWNLYINKLNKTDFISELTQENVFFRKLKLTPYTHGIDNYILRNNDNIVFWYMPIP